MAKNGCQCFVLKLALADTLPGGRSWWLDLLQGDAMASCVGWRKRCKFHFWLLIWHVMASGKFFQFEARHQAVVRVPCWSCKSKVPLLFFQTVLVIWVLKLVFSVFVLVSFLCRCRCVVSVSRAAHSRAVFFKGSLVEKLPWLERWETSFIRTLRNFLY